MPSSLGPKADRSNGKNYQRKREKYRQEARVPKKPQKFKLGEYQAFHGRGVSLTLAENLEAARFPIPLCKARRVSPFVRRHAVWLATARADMVWGDVNV
jgi:hypothetical protein